MNTKLFHNNQDEIMENIMLFSPMPVLQAIQDSYLESVLADMHTENAESVPVQSGHKPSAKQRRAARRVQNARHKKSDRTHGKRHGDKYLNSLPRKKYLEADNYDHPTFRVEKGKLRPIHDVKRAREAAKVRDAMDISEIERLTASVLAEVQQYHGMVGCTWNVFYLSEAICRREQLPYPDYAYVCEQKGKCKLILEYVEYDHEDYTTYECFDLRI